MRRLLQMAMAAAIALAPASVRAQADDAAARQVEAFDSNLLEIMKQAKGLDAARRAQRFEPVIARTFDLAAMTRFAVGPSWSTLAAGDQETLVKAFSRMTVATYAHNFDGYSGERFVVDTVDTRGPDKLVHTRVLSTGAAPVSLAYRMRQSAGSWKVIDVYYNGAISSLTGQRAEFAATLGAGGAAALAKKLNDQADGLLRR